MIDPELEAIVKSTELLKDLSDESRIRVLQYLISRYNLKGAENPSVPTSETSHPIPALLNEDPEETAPRKKNAAHHGEYPALKDVVTKDLPKSEVEWVLVYCFYASDYGSKEFTREDVSNNYKTTKRWIEQTRRNLSANIGAVVKRDWIKSLNDTEFIMKDTGTTYAKEVVAGNSTAKERKPRKKGSPIAAGKGHGTRG